MTRLTAPAIASARMVGTGLRGNEAVPPEDAVQRLVAMQAQEHPSARWSVGQRSGAASSAVDRAFDEGRILRTHVLRPTWHYVAAADLGWLMALSGPRVDAGIRRRYNDLGLDPAGDRAIDLIAEAVAGTALTRHEVAERLRDGGVSVDGQRLPHLLIHAELHAAVCSGPMRGRQHTYASFDDRVPATSGPSGDEALAGLARRYVATRGPATVKDFAWWAGLRMGDARLGLSLAGPELESRTVDGRTYFFTDVPRRRRGPRVDLVQCYDEVIISYTESRGVLAGQGIDFPVPRAIDGFSHVVLLDGFLLGHWRLARTSAGQRVETRVRRPLDPAEQRALATAIASYEAFATS